MAMSDSLIDDLADRSSFGYQPDDDGASEPTALAAWALAVHQRDAAATCAWDWLVSVQSPQGYVPVSRQVDQPRWTTSLAILAWKYGMGSAALESREWKRRYRASSKLAVDWLLSLEGETLPQPKFFRHDTTLVAWPWVAGTHSWVEPTALAVLALKSVDQSHHMRTREGIRLLMDRLLPTGGCNYGNTAVMGKILRPHLQPTGMALAALAGEPIADKRLARSLSYLHENVGPETPTASLCWALMGLAAHQQLPQQASEWLEHSYDTTLRRDASPYKLSLLALALACVQGRLRFPLRGGG